MFRNISCGSKLCATCFAALMFLNACDESSESSQQTGGASQSFVSAPFNIGTIIQKIHFSYRALENGFSAGHSTYGVYVDSDGKFDFTPYHYMKRDVDKIEHKTKAIKGAPVFFETISVTKGDARLDVDRPKGQVDKNGELIISRGLVVEKFKNTEEGVQQNWLFDRALQSMGDLIVRVQVSGQNYAGTTEHGLHFVDQETGIGVRYGWATWIDVNGKQTQVKGKFVRDEIVMEVPSTVVATSTFPCILDPIISAEFGMDNPVSGPASMDQQTPSVAYDGTNFFAVWADYRNGTYLADIYGARVNSSGTVIDTTGIVIKTNTQSWGSPAVVHNGTNYFVVWQDSPLGVNLEDIYGKRISNAGAVLDSSGIAICTNGYRQEYPSLAHNGTNYLVAWRDNRNGNNDIYGARVNNSGTVLDTSGIAISTATNTQAFPKVAALSGSGSNFLVAWWDTRNGGNYDIYGARVNNSGTVLDTSGIAISTMSNSQERPSVSAYSSTNYFVVWADKRTGIDYQIYGARVSSTGSVLDSSGSAISIAAGDQYYPAITHNGTDYVVVWSDKRNGSEYDIYGARVNSSSGVVIDSTGFAVSTNTGDKEQPSIVKGGTQTLAVWQDERSGTNVWDIYGSRINSSGSVLDPSGIIVAQSYNEQETPSVAYDGTNYLVVWQDYRNGDADIYGARVTATGTMLDSNGIAISTGTTGVPDISYGSSKYLVAWAEDSNIYGVRISTTGNKLDSTPITIKAGMTGLTITPHPKVASNGTDYLVVWHDSSMVTPSGNDILGVRISDTGSVLDTSAFSITTASGSSEYPDVAYGGSNYFVVWHEITVDDYIYGARVTSSGTVLDPSGVAISTTTSVHAYPSIDHDGTNFLVVWQETRGLVKDIYGARVTNAATVLDPSGLSIAVTSGVQEYPKVSYNGINFLVVWQDDRNGNDDIYGNRVTSSGTGLDSTGFVINASSTDDQSPVTACTTAGSCIVAYKAYYSARSANQIRGRIVSDKGSLGDPCSVDSQCLSGYCSDKVCCNTDCGFSATDDCQACSTVAGASVNGTCGPVTSGTACRPVAGDCDLAEICNGVSTACPQDSFKAPGTECRAATGVCDAAETCSGSSASCPADAYKGTSDVCRAAAGTCDAIEYCTGTTVTCSSDLLKSYGTVCRPAAHGCDAIEYCTGSAVYCPADLLSQNGITCDDANSCTYDGTCQGGQCLGALQKPNGTSCPGGTCQSGVCIVLPDSGVSDSSVDSGVVVDTLHDSAITGDTTPNPDIPIVTDTIPSQESPIVVDAQQDIPFDAGLDLDTIIPLDITSDIDTIAPTDSGLDLDGTISMDMQTDIDAEVVGDAGLDAYTKDTQVQGDTYFDPGKKPTDDEGCGCSVQSQSQIESMFWFGFIVLMLVIRKRRERKAS